jgi:predicted transcriptional regulator
MPKLKLSDRERQNRTLIAIIQSAKVMEGVSVEKLSKLTGIPKSTLYQRFSVPEDIRLGELREILKVLKIPEEEKERIGREVI